MRLWVQKGSNVNRLKWLKASKNNLNETRLHKWNQENTKCETTLLLYSLSLFQLHWIFLKMLFKRYHFNAFIRIVSLSNVRLLKASKIKIWWRAYETTYNMAPIKITVRIS